MSAPPPPAGENRGIRISDADRESAARRLHTALGEGRITVAELEERLATVYAARYEADLLPPLADLPGGPPVVAAPRGLSVPAERPVVLRTGMGNLKRRGPWPVPARLRVQSVMGSAVLDFCDTAVPHAVVEIELDMGAGSARILVPDDATADVDGVVAAMGTVKCHVPSTPRAGTPHFRVFGRAGMGSVTVRRRYRFAGHYF